jgi:hypothetical protein
VECLLSNQQEVGQKEENFCTLVHRHVSYSSNCRKENHRDSNVEKYNVVVMMIMKKISETTSVKATLDASFLFKPERQ